MRVTAAQQPRYTRLQTAHHGPMAGPQQLQHNSTLAGAAPTADMGTTCDGGSARLHLAAIALMVSVYINPSTPNYTSQHAATTIERCDGSGQAACGTVNSVLLCLAPPLADAAPKVFGCCLLWSRPTARHTLFLRGGGGVWHGHACSHEPPQGSLTDRNCPCGWHMCHMTRARAHGTATCAWGAGVV